MRLDPLVGVQPRGVDVDVGEDTYAIPPRPAEDWLAILNGGAVASVVPGLLEDPAVLDDALLDDLDGSVAAECAAAGRAAIAAAAGMPWWVAARLAQVTAATWVAHELTLRAVDPGRLSLAAYLGAAYHAATRNMDEVKRAEFDAQLQQPPTGVDVDEWFDEEQAAAGFLEAMGGVDQLDADSAAGGLDQAEP